jgi:ubiquitin-conjugating enzyme E2 O
LYWSRTHSIVSFYINTLEPLVNWYLDEAGYDSYVGARDVAVSADLYIEKAYILSRGFVRHVLEKPVAGFEKEIQTLYVPGVANGLGLLEKVVTGVEKVINDSTDAAKEGHNALEISPNGSVVRITAGALMLLKKDLVVLEKFLGSSGSSGSST